MGIKNNFFLSEVTSSIKTKSFMEMQVCWGHKKTSLNPSLNFYILGFSNNLVIFNSEHSLEHLKRCVFFCSKIISNGGNILFLSTETDYKKMSFFFACRSMQFFYSNKWIYGLLIKNFLPAVSAIVTPQLDKKGYLTKEATGLFVPIVSIEDSDFCLNKSIYSFSGNNGSKKSVYFFYKNMTDSNIKTILLNHYCSLRF